MKKYLVGIREVHVSTVEAYANSEDDAIKEARLGACDEIMLEYSHTMDSSTWSVELAEPPKNTKGGMTGFEVDKLQPGDTVLWTDPDNGECTQYVTIRRITLVGDIVRVEHAEGELECLAEELS